MSGSGFHVHGPHDHELEHAAKHGGHQPDSGSTTNQIALFTATIATVGAIFGYMGGLTQANAGIYKNNAAIKKTEAANQWSYFQSKSTKQSLSELALELGPASKKDFYESEIKRYKAEKNEIKIRAEQMDVLSAEWDIKSADEMHLHHRWAQATTVVQVSIALAAIALLTRKKWLKMGMYSAGAIAMAWGCLALAHI